MDSILIILLVIAAIKIPIMGGFLWYIFRDDIREWRRDRKAAKAPRRVPVCLYCGSHWTAPVDEGQSRWERDELILVTTYQCQHCSLPFWHVERVALSSTRTS